MFCSSLLLGLLGGVIGAKLVTRHRFGGWGHRGHHRFGMFRAVRSLGLDRSQKEELWAIAREVKQSFGDVRFGGMQGIDTLLEAVTADTFDKPSVEAAAKKQGDAVVALREKLVGAAEKVHQILTPEQRARLRSMLGGGWAGGPAGGPYRTAL
jgi:Spy/CpxP family protein refolding chaperone